VERRTHTVKSGETLSLIAQKNGCTVKQLYAENGGAAKLKTLRIGQKILLPYTEEELKEVERRRQIRQKQAEEARKAAELRAREETEQARAEALSSGNHTVEKGDTLYGIAKKYGVSVLELQQANGGADKLKNLRVGQSIRLPGAKAKAEAPKVEAPAVQAAPVLVAPVPEAPKAVPGVSKPNTHTVESGDTLSRIARKYGITVRELQQANGGAGKLKTLRIGQKLALPGAVEAEEAGASDAAAALSELKAMQAAPAPVVQAAPAKASAPKAAQTEKYTVQPGDSIWAITHRFGMSEAEFKRLNPSVDSSSLRLGASVNIIRKK
jgi:LysM repeat protein